eukprot:14940158-Alexandrium_andersonii.AAC.1
MTLATVGTRSAPRAGGGAGSGMLLCLRAVGRTFELAAGSGIGVAAATATCCASAGPYCARGRPSSACARG